jgi:hypothetical protein
VSLIVIGVTAQNPNLGIVQCLGVCEQKNTDGSVQLCGGCYDTDPYYQNNWPGSYFSPTAAETDGYRCTVNVPAHNPSESRSATYAKDVQTDIHAHGAETDFGCGACQYSSVASYEKTFQNAPIDYPNPADARCVRDSSGVANAACNRKYYFTKKCLYDLDATLLAGTFSPTPAPGGPKLKYDYLIGIIVVGMLLLLATVALLRMNKSAASGDSKSVELSEYIPPGVSVPDPSHVILVTSTEQLASISKELVPAGYDPNQPPAFDSEQQYPQNDSAKLLCKKFWTTAPGVKPGHTTTTSIDFEYLRERTDGFSSSHVIGEGASCKVYATTIYYGVEVAIKCLASNASDWEAQQFTSEVELLSKVRHENICQLYGCSTNGPQRCLVLERMSYALEDRLKTKPTLSWQQRVYVAVLACRGLAHLHSLEPKMIHRDFKSAVLYSCIL